jgi:hypothetical protein
MAINVNGFGNKLSGIGLNNAITKASSIGDCFKDIDNLVLENVQKQVIDNISQIPDAKALSQNISKMQEMSKTVEDVGKEINKLKEKNLSDLLKQAAAAGILERISIIADIQSKFGDAVEDLNSLVDNITSFDPCSLVDYKVDASGNAKPIPQAGQFLNEPPAPFPSFTPPVNVNYAAEEAKADYRQAMARMGDVVNDKTNVTKTESGMSMMSSLQFIGRDFHDSLGGIRKPEVLPYATEQSSDPMVALQQAADEELRKNSKTWTADDKKEFEVRVSQLLDLGKKDGEILSKHFKIKKTEEGPNSWTGDNFFKIPDNILSPPANRKTSDTKITKASIAIGSLASTGITIYGGPDWNYLRFLSISPEERPDELVEYWVNERNKDIEEDVDKLSNQFGLKLGTRSYNSIFIGVYNKKLKSGYSVSSTKFKGGTVLQLKNKDGSIYDPAGINAKGLVTVVDAAEGIKDFSLLNLYVDAEHVDAYSKTQLQSVQAFLYSSGTDESSLYTQAQTKWG